MLEWRHVTEEDDIKQVKNLFRDYADWLQIDLTFQNFEKELETLPGEYAPPTGALFMVKNGEEPVGCVALKQLNKGVAEMKRLYVKESFREKGLGKSLAMRAIDVAEALGYESICLDTLGHMKKAIALYKYLGFEQIAPYYEGHPDPDAVFMEKKL